MALEGEVFCVRWASEVRQAPGQESPLLYTVREGQLVTRLGPPVQLADGTQRIPVLPRGWVNADSLDPVAGDNTADRDSDTAPIQPVRRLNVGEPEETQPMPSAEASSAAACNWLELLGDDRTAKASSAESCNWLGLLADDRNIGRPRTTPAVQGPLSPERPPWREPKTPVPPGRQVHLPGVLLSDAGLRQWFDTEGPRHLARLGPGPLDCMDLSHNNLTDQGTDDVVSFLLWRGQQTKRLKLFNNYLLEPLALCRLLEDEQCGVGAVDGITELHLSHNKMNISVLERLLSSVAARLDKVDKDARLLRPPLWLRVEQNDLEREAQDLLKETRSGVKLCFECDIKERRHGRYQGCTLVHCKNGADVHLF